jgi:transcriptional regulator with XRE-family HTH domain
MPDSLQTYVAAEIRAEMARRRITGQQLAGALGRSNAWISVRLAGKQAIDLNDLERIADALDVSADQLLPARSAA